MEDKIWQIKQKQKDSTSDEEDHLSTTSEKDVAEIENFVPTAVPSMTFPVVKVYSNANKYRNFVA